MRFGSKPELQQTTLSEVFVIEPELFEWLPVEFRFLDINVVRRIIVGFDFKFLTWVILRVELDGDLVEFRCGDFVDRLFRAGAAQAEESEFHQGADATHLALVFVVSTVADQRACPTVCLFANTPDPSIGSAMDGRRG